MPRTHRTRTAGAIAEHITHPSGRRKTVCTSTCLDHWGVPPTSYHYCESFRDMLRLLRREGFSVRSRLSRLPKSKRRGVGALRLWLRANAPEHAEYLVRVPGHVIAMNARGETIVDTAPRRRDVRPVLGLWVVYSPGRTLARLRRDRKARVGASRPPNDTLDADAVALALALTALGA